MAPTGPQSLTGNPLANAITAVLGVIALAAAIAFGLVAFVIFAIAAAVFVSVVALRVWWLGRKLKKRVDAAPGPSRQGATVIDVEYEVLDRDKKS